MLAFLDKVLEVPTIQREDIIYCAGLRSEFKNKYMMKAFLHLSKKHQVPITWYNFATGHGKSVVDGIGEERKNFVRQQVLSKMN